MLVQDSHIASAVSSAALEQLWTQGAAPWGEEIFSPLCQVALQDGAKMQHQCDSSGAASSQGGANVLYGRFVTSLAGRAAAVLAVK